MLGPNGNNGDNIKAAPSDETMFSKATRPLLFFILLLLVPAAAFCLGGCGALIPSLPPSASSTPLDKKYPAAVLVGTEANPQRGTVRNSSAPLPANQTLYFSVRSFGGFGTRELTAELTRETSPAPESKQFETICRITLPVEAGKPNVLGSLPPLPPGRYRLTIYRGGEDIAAREFIVQ